MEIVSYKIKDQAKDEPTVKLVEVPKHEETDKMKITPDVLNSKLYFLK